VSADDLVTAIRSELAAAADPARAPQMQAYMKSVLPFYGAPMPVVRTTVRRLVREHPLASRHAWEEVVRRLFDEATHREERYAALAIAGNARYQTYQTMASLPLYRHLVVTGAWWDLVDDVSHRVGDTLLRERFDTSIVVRQWAREPDIWLRRSSIICQRGHKSATDTELLAEVIEVNVEDREFFLRKAIGWALREYAKVNPAWVLAFVRSRETTLSKLSRREALKHLAEAAGSSY
jgi:3-methyladenine DNA glycosylase AlkD